MAEELEGLATLLRGRDERAARLLGAAAALREAVAAPRPAAERARHERAVAAVRAALGEQLFTAAWEIGRALSPEDAVATALTVKERPRARGAGPSTLRRST